jgi:hypothetical protein
MQSTPGLGDSTLQQGVCRVVAAEAFPHVERIGNDKNGGGMWIQGLQTSRRRRSSAKAYQGNFRGEGYRNGSAGVRLSGEHVLSLSA